MKRQSHTRFLSVLQQINIPPQFTRLLRYQHYYWSKYYLLPFSLVIEFLCAHDYSPGRCFDPDRTHCHLSPIINQIHFSQSAHGQRPRNYRQHLYIRVRINGHRNWVLSMPVNLGDRRGLEANCSPTTQIDTLRGV